MLTPYFPFDTQSFARLAPAWRRTFFEEAFRAGLDLVTTVAITHRHDSGDAFPLDLPHMRLETEHRSAGATARRIAEHFGPPRVDDLGCEL